MDYLILAMIVSFAGGIWMFMDSYDRFGWFPALILVGSHLFVFLETTFPAVLILYFIFWLIGIWVTSRKLPEDEAPRFGRHVTTTDPKGAAAKLGLPSVMGGADSSKPEPEEMDLVVEVDVELERMLRLEKVREALKIAQERFAEATAAGNYETAETYRKYIRRIERGDY